MSVLALELVLPGLVAEADDDVLLGGVELGEVELDLSVLAVLELELGAVDGDVLADDDEDGGVVGTTTVDELEAGGADDVPGAASWRCWQAPNASSRLAATAV